MKTTDDVRRYAFCDGAHIAPYQFPDGHWGWIVREFDGTVYVDGEAFNAADVSETEEGLIELEEQDE